MKKNELSPFDIDPIIKKLFEIPMGFISKMPAIDIIDKDKQLLIRADLPGVDKKDIKLKIDKNSLIIAATSSKKQENKKEYYYYSERRSTSYYRRIALPVPVVPETAKAKFENGTLEIIVDKAKEEGKDIEIS